MSKPTHRLAHEPRKKNQLKKNQPVDPSSSSSPFFTPARGRHRQYMDSSEWAQRKRRYWLEHDRRCAACGTEQDIHLHHLSYEHMGSEPDEDLLPLCATHHDHVHRHHRLSGGGDLRDATRYVLAELHERRLRQPQAPPRPAGTPPPDFVPRHLRKDVAADALSRASRPRVVVDNGDGKKHPVPKRLMR